MLNSFFLNCTLNFTQLSLEMIIYAFCFYFFSVHCYISMEILKVGNSYSQKWMPKQSRWDFSPQINRQEQTLIMSYTHTHLHMSVSQSATLASRTHASRAYSTLLSQSWLCSLIFPLQASVKPKCGRMVGFSSGGENPHGVRAVTKGQRCAVALWFTLDPLFRELVQ